MNEDTTSNAIIGPEPVIGYWWTGTATGAGNLYVVRAGFFRGDVVELAMAIIAERARMHDPTVPHVLDNASDVEAIRNWDTAVDMLLHASEILNEELPTLLPLPYGCGILYFAGEVTEEQWRLIRQCNTRNGVRANGRDAGAVTMRSL
jgi:hypothetical protein